MMTMMKVVIQVLPFGLFYYHGVILILIHNTIVHCNPWRPSSGTIMFNGGDGFSIKKESDPA